MIIDCFTFFNEMDLLEIRLNELNDVVDKFVIVEATRTHQGKPKPLNFENNKARYQAFLSKITYIVVDDFPDENAGVDAWVRENAQRKAAIRALTDAPDDAVVLISDIDEIPRAQSVAEASKKIKGNQLIVFRQKMYYYYLNCINNSLGNSYMWHGTVMIRKQYLKDPQSLRFITIRMMGLYHAKMLNRIYWRLMKYKYEFKNNVAIRFAHDAGWHFSYLGGIKKIIEKLEAFAHTEYNKQEYKDPEHIEKLISSGKDIFGRPFTYSYTPLDNSYPQYVLLNQDKFKFLILPKE